MKMKYFEILETVNGIQRQRLEVNALQLLKHLYNMRYRKYSLSKFERMTEGKHQYIKSYEFKITLKVKQK